MIKNKLNKDELLFIYNPVQAKYMANNGAEIYMISKGVKGDVCLSFEKNEKNLKLFYEFVHRKQI